MSDVRHQATWRLVGDGRWELEVREDVPAHLPAHLRERFEIEEDSGPTLRCEASEVPSIMAEIVNVAAWWEPPRRTHYRLRADRAFEAAFLRDVLRDAGIEVSLWQPIPTAEGDVEVEFFSDATLDLLRGVMQSSPGGDRMRQTVAALDGGRAGEREAHAPPAKGEA